MEGKNCTSKEQQKTGSDVETDRMHIHAEICITAIITIIIQILFSSSSRGSLPGTRFQDVKAAGGRPFPFFK
jgi:hypothetical protein